MEAPALEGILEDEDSCRHENCNHFDVPEFVTIIKQEIIDEVSQNSVDFKVEELSKAAEQSASSQFLALENLKTESKANEEIVDEWKTGEEKLTVKSKEASTSSDGNNQEKHTDHKRHRCGVCGYQTNYKSNLNKHSLVHGNTETDGFSCDKCHFKTLHKAALKRHVLRHELPEGDFFQCDQCEYRTCGRAALNVHVLRHSRPKPKKEFKCVKCEFKTIYRYSLKVHLLIHKDVVDEDLLLKCCNCEYRTRRERLLRGHILRHKRAEEKDNLKSPLLLECNQCPYTTRNKSHIKRHALRHQNPKDVDMFRCDKCDFKTFDKSNLKRHVLRHVNYDVRVFECGRTSLRPGLKPLKMVKSEKK